MTMNKHYIFGLHAVEAVLKNQPERIIHLYIQLGRQDKKIDNLVQQAKKLGIAIEQASRQELDRCTQEGNHQGAVIFCNKAKTY